MQNEWFHEGESWVSPYNFDKDITDRPYFPKKILMHDTTLRDGEQTSGVVFGLEERLAIAKKLDEIGVQRIEAGSPMVSQDDCNSIKEIVQLGLKAEISCLSRAMEADIDKAVDCGVDRAVIEIPIGVPRLKYQYSAWSEDDTLEKAVRTIKYAKSKGLLTTLFMMDTARSEESFLRKVVTTMASDAKPEGIAVVDTSGCFIPAATYKVIRLVKELFDGTVEIHTHNDLGLGLANTLAAIEAGAEVVHTCVNGLGERSGNVALDEVVMALYSLYNYDTGVIRPKLTETCKLVETFSKINVAGNKPITGPAIFRRESGMGVDLIEKAPLGVFSLVPAAVGQTPQIVLGKKSGIASIKSTFVRLGLEELNDEGMRKILALVKEKGIEEKRLVTDEELLEIVQKVKGGKAG